MVTHYPYQIGSEQGLAPASDARGTVERLVGTVLAWLRQSYCGLHGHDKLLRFEKDRMCLECASCGHQSPGWDLSELPKPTKRLRGDARRHALNRPRLVSERRIA